MNTANPGTPAVDPGQRAETLQRLVTERTPTNASGQSTAASGTAANPDGNGTTNGNGAHAYTGHAAPPRPWSVTESARLYGIHSWGQGYFSINPDGHVAVHPTQDPKL